VGGRLGHLNNGQAVKLLESLDRRALQHLIAGHISEKNNSPAHVREAVAHRLPAEAEALALAPQEQGLGWHDIRPRL
jgi:phosphoribosyl 1,2-cyclic phosphodiesterase